MQDSSAVIFLQLWTWFSTVSGIFCWKRRQINQWHWTNSLERHPRPLTRLHCHRCLQRWRLSASRRWLEEEEEWNACWPTLRRWSTELLSTHGTCVTSLLASGLLPLTLPWEKPEDKEVQNIVCVTNEKYQRNEKPSPCVSYLTWSPLEYKCARRSELMNCFTYEWIPNENLSIFFATTKLSDWCCNPPFLYARVLGEQKTNLGTR